MNIFKDLSIKAKMMTLVCSLLLLILLTALFGYFKLQLIGHELEGITDQDIPLTTITTDITTKQLESAILIERSIRLAGIIGEGDQQSLYDQFSMLSKDIEIELVKAEEFFERCFWT